MDDDAPTEEDATESSWDTDAIGLDAGDASTVPGDAADDGSTHDDASTLDVDASES